MQSQQKPPLLLLVHRIPYPPNKGDKIRSYHLLLSLLRHYRVFLGCFIDDPADQVHREKLQQLCAGTCFVTISPTVRKLASLRGLLSGTALTLPYYASRKLQAWVDQVVQGEDIRHAIAFSSATAQFLLHTRFAGMRRVMDFIDIDSDKWLQYAERKKFPMNRVYRREGERLLCFERQVARQFDASVFVSEHEAALFRSLAPRSADKVHAIYNGVDLQRFAADPTLRNPFAEQQGVARLVFVGAMDYWPNVDAVQWFVREVMPLLRARRRIALWIVGGNPTREVQSLQQAGDVHVTGRVDDIRDYVQHADVCVAPLRIARGIQNKVLESLAMARPTVVTSPALEGIPAESGRHLMLADTPSAICEAIENLLDDEQLRSRLANEGRALMEKCFAWDRNLQHFQQLLEAPPAGMG